MNKKSEKFMHGSPVLMGDNTIPGVSIPPELKKILPEIYKKVSDFGCDFYPTVVEMLTYDEISEIAAYGGFPVRYPHWRWGMEYEELQRGYMHGMHKIYEMVVNSRPVYLYCLDSNTLVDNVTVVAHALGHADFFKNNIYFSQTSQNMMNQLANHGTRMREYMSRWGKERVTEFIDHVLRIETLIDFSKAWERKKIKNPIIKDERKYKHPNRLKSKQDHDYMEDYLNPQEWIDNQKEKIEKNEAAEYLDIFNNPTKDIMKFIRDYAPLKPWEADIVAMLYDESMYFAPQRLTKTINEGFACVSPDTLISTKIGMLSAKEIVEKNIRSEIFDGEGNRSISNWFKFDNRNLISVETNRGYKLTGSENHRILNEQLNWIRLDEVKVGDKIKIKSNNIWSNSLYEINYKVKERITSRTIKNILGKKYWKYNYFRIGIYDAKKAGKEIVELSDLYDRQVDEFGQTQVIRRKKIKIPNKVDCNFSKFIGYMIGDGHISKKRRTLGLTTGDAEQAKEYQELLKLNFGLSSQKKWDNSSKNGRWRINCSSKNLQELLEFLGMKTGVCARQKEVPECILKSPKKVMSSFLSSYFDCDGYAGKQGVILSTASEKLGEQIQVILLNYGIICSRKKVSSKNPKKTHVWQIRITGNFSKIFYKEIGFGLRRKQVALKKYIDDHKFFKKDIWTEEITSVSSVGKGTVYDITVDDTHKYVAHGFTNHNSYVDYNIMARQGFSSLGQENESAGIIEYSHHKMGVLGGKYSMNPYKLGFCLFLDIEERWNKGQFGSEWENCEDIREKENWDKKLNLGHEKVFEVRKFYNDLTFIMEFFTAEFCEKYQFFEWKKYPNGEYKIENRDHKKIKKKLIQRYTNGGLPEIYLTDCNHKGKGILFLEHKSDGRPLYDPYIRPVIQSLRHLWKNDVCLSTKTTDGSELIYRCLGEDIIDVVEREQYLGLKDPNYESY